MRATIFITAVFLSLSLGVRAQDAKPDSIVLDVKPDSVVLKGIYERKLIFGVYGNFGLSNITNAGGDSIARKAKPSMGGGIRVEYYPVRWLGISVGLGVQQKGSIYKSSFSGNSDSLNYAVRNVPVTTDVRTNNRLKLSGIELPIMLHLRTPKEIVRNLRLSAAIGLIPTYNFRMVYATADANVVNINLTHNIIPWDLNYTVSLGPEISTGKSSIIRLHIFGKWGTVNSYKNVAQNPAFSGFTGGKNNYYGCSLSLLFR
jgi:hypothetical protein